MTNRLSWHKAFSINNERTISTPSGDTLLEESACAFFSQHVLSVLQEYFRIPEETKWKIHVHDEIIGNVKEITKWILPIIS